MWKLHSMARRYRVYTWWKNSLLALPVDRLQIRLGQSLRRWNRNHQVYAQLHRGMEYKFQLNQSEYKRWFQLQNSVGLSVWDMRVTFQEFTE